MHPECFRRVGRLKQLAEPKEVSSGPGMDQCCIEGCTKPHSNHVYNDAVGHMRELPNSQR